MTYKDVPRYLVENELYTLKEAERIGLDRYNVVVREYAVKIETKKTNTFWSFGARFLFYESTYTIIQ